MIIYAENKEEYNSWKKYGNRKHTTEELIQNRSYKDDGRIRKYLDELEATLAEVV